MKKVINAKIVWKSVVVSIKDILPTPKNYKIKTELGRERLHTSLKKFGLASNVVVNAKDKKGKYVLIDGNSRYLEEKEKGARTMAVSIPNRPLTQKEFTEMSAMFDFAKAGEVDEDMIKGDLGNTKEFFDAWGLKLPKELAEKLEVVKTKREQVEVIAKGKSKQEKEVKIKEQEFEITLFYTPEREQKFRKLEELIAKAYETESVSDTVFKALELAVKGAPKQKSKK
jgi:hypothetical protein